jgi:hypothetical protein
MACPSYETLIAYVADDLPNVAGDAVERHLAAGCGDCGYAADQARATRVLAEALSSAPREWVARAARIPRDMVAGIAREIVAVLACDTFRSPSAAGTRSARSHDARQILFRAGDFDVDLRVAPSGADRVRLSGQLFYSGDGDADERTTGAALLLTGRGAALERRTGALGEFSFESVPDGDYDLTIDAGTARLLVESVPVRRR